MDRLFLDANVLFSAAYSADSPIRQLWDLSDVELLSSDYAVAEARRNLSAARAGRLPELDSLLAKVEVSAGPSTYSGISNELRIDWKDAPILAGAVEAGATHLITGDKRHFGHLYGRLAKGVKVLTTDMYRRERGLG